MQSLSLENDTLKISGGMGVSLESFKSPWERIDSGYILDLEPTLARSGFHKGLRIKYLERIGTTLSIEDEDCYYELGPKYFKRSVLGQVVRSFHRGPLGSILPVAIADEVKTNFDIDDNMLASTKGSLKWSPNSFNVEGMIPNTGDPKHFSYRGHGMWRKKAIDEPISTSIIKYYNDERVGDVLYDKEQGTGGLSTYVDGQFVGGYLTNKVAFAGRQQSSIGAGLFTASENGLTTQLGSFPGLDQSNGWLTLYRENSPVVLATANDEEDRPSKH